MGTAPIQNEIQQFFDHFREVAAYFRRQLAPNVHSPHNHEFLAGKMACCSLLDALAVARFPKKRQVGKRLRAFIREFCERGYWDCVSLPQIAYALDVPRNTDEQKLCDYAKKHLAGRNEYAIQSDPPAEELVAKFPSHAVLISKYTHVALFSKYRNHLVHEMRQPGYGYEFRYDENPCYRGQKEIPGGRRTFQLTYPLEFFFSLCDESITNLETFFLTNNRNPFDAYESRFGDVW